MTRSAVWPSRGPTYRITPPSTPSVPMKLEAPVPSQIRAFLITRSIMGAPLSAARFPADATGAILPERGRQVKPRGERGDPNGRGGGRGLGPARGAPRAGRRNG